MLKQCFLPAPSLIIRGNVASSESLKVSSWIFTPRRKPVFFTCFTFHKTATCQLIASFSEHQQPDKRRFANFRKSNQAHNFDHRYPPLTVRLIPILRNVKFVEVDKCSYHFMAVGGVLPGTIF